MEKPYTIDWGIDTSNPDGDYEYIAVYDPQGYACAIFYTDAIPNAEAEAQNLCNRLNNSQPHSPKSPPSPPQNEATEASAQPLTANHKN